jgi:hypothetical protein
VVSGWSMPSASEIAQHNAVGFLGYAGILPEPVPSLTTGKSIDGHLDRHSDPLPRARRYGAAGVPFG